MVLTVTLNPLLERRLKYQNVSLGMNHRNGELEIQAGGKGINVSRQLNIFGIDNLAFTFIGGNNGKIFNETVHNEKIKFSAIRTKSETRSASVIIDESANNLTTFFEPSSEISVAEADEFLSKLEKMIPNFDTIVLSGSSPSAAADHIFAAAIEIAHKNDKISICDTYGLPLQQCIDAGPTIIHNNLDEIKDSLKINISGENDCTEFLSYLYSKKIKQVFLTDGSRPSYCSNFDYHFKVENPVIKALDATGSGDAFVSGVIYGWENDFTFEDILSFASSCGAANAASFNVCKVSLNEIESLRKDVVISSIGKKMKLIDVTPQ